MIDLKAIDDLARRLNDLVPPGLHDARADLEQNFKATLQTGLNKLNLVTRCTATHPRKNRYARTRHRSSGSPLKLAFQQ